MLCVLFHVNFEVAWVTERISTKVTKAKFFLSCGLALRSHGHIKIVTLKNNKYFFLSNKTQANDSQIGNESIQDFQT